MTIGIYEVDLKTGIFINLDRVICENLGYTQEELRGQPVTNVLTPESAKQFRDRMQRVSAGETLDTKANFMAVTKAQKRIPISIEAFFEIKNGVIVGAIVAAKERTENGTDT